MNAKRLIKQLQAIAKDNGVRLEDLEVTFREDYNSCDIHEVNAVDEGLHDEETNSRLVEVVLLTSRKGL